MPRSGQGQAHDRPGPPGIKVHGTAVVAQREHGPPVATAQVLLAQRHGTATLLTVPCQHAPVAADGLGWRSPAWSVPNETSASPVQASCSDW